MAFHHLSWLPWVRLYTKFKAMKMRLGAEKAAQKKVLREAMKSVKVSNSILHLFHISVAH